MDPRRSVTASALLLVSSLLFPVDYVSAQPPPLCGDIQLIWARGTNDPEDDDPGNVAFTKLQGRISTSQVSFSRYRLGTENGFLGYECPATGGALEFILEATPLDRLRPTS